MAELSRILTPVERGVITALGKAPTSIQRLIGGPLPVADGVTIEPEVGAALRLLNLIPGSSFEELPVDEARAQIDAEAALFGGAPIPMHAIEDVTIPTPAGSIRGRRYVADARDADRLVLYFHGGGWVVGSLDSADTACRFLARHSGASVLSVGYRLAPEQPFPAAPDDALAAFRFAVACAGTWGHDPARIAVAGDSAGGNLAAVLCQDLRTADEQRPAFQLLFFPVTDLSTKHASYRRFSDGFFLTEQQMDWYRTHYLADQDATDPRVSPLLARDLTGLPPAYVAVSGFDVLRDEGEAYARAMAAAGVTVGLRRHDRLIHAFVNSTGVGTSSREAFLEACGALRAGIGAGTAAR
ncbi:MAG: alpha/beta hydrolase [Candidatus Nanopelagicales bacterium]|jgi:acetyl esterase|nr:alpha/beta hydrolase [Candidatus Nanopelagicales bacterium]